MSKQKKYLDFSFRILKSLYEFFQEDPGDEVEGLREHNHSKCAGKVTDPPKVVNKSDK